MKINKIFNKIVLKIKYKIVISYKKISQTVVK